MSDGTYNHLGDHTQWSSARMTGVGLAIAGGVAAAFTGALVAAATNRRQPRVLSAKAIRMSEEEFVRADMALLELRLQYVQREARETERRVAELEAEALERLYRSRY